MGSRRRPKTTPAVVGYTFATLLAAFAITCRYAMWPQRRPTRMYWRRGGRYSQRDAMFGAPEPVQLSQAERKNVRAAGDGDVLIAVHGVGHRTGLPVLVGGELPEPLAMSGVDSDETLIRAEEDEAGGGRQQTAAADVAAHGNLPCGCSGLDVERVENASGGARPGRAPGD